MLGGFVPSKGRTLVTNAEGRYSIVDVRPGANVLTLIAVGAVNIHIWSFKERIP
jgi:hypothetical protein